MRNWLIKKLVGKRSIMMNMDLSGEVKVNNSIQSELFNGNKFRSEEQDGEPENLSDILIDMNLRLSQLEKQPLFVADLTNLPRNRVSR